MSASDKPNLLILFTDMQRADTIHALGNPVIRTPNLDRPVAACTMASTRRIRAFIRTAP